MQRRCGRAGFGPPRPDDGGGRWPASCVNLVKASGVEEMDEIRSQGAPCRGGQGGAHTLVAGASAKLWWRQGESPAARMPPCRGEVSAEGCWQRR
ncbi:hypothetical protein E2562_032542 [Oryza meyeriana var. granulata]|uniref:Uncharacterized protein n=1 Tax=Oryza meyeriana var. granulata TaxID=110450 RepID=A0A6G1CVK7_9ORYZ|nr:hypothetical protein E2562_032542 [Oryza meyeriana var. granulata]